MDLKTLMKEVHDIDITNQQQDMLMRDLQEIMVVNQTHNLTSIPSIELGVVRHLEDSLLGLHAFKAAPQGLYADLGTGGGFPGIPLAIMTGRNTLLVDSVKKKVVALEGVVETLGLSDIVSGYAGRIEDLALERGKQFSVLTARALSSLPSLLELASPLLMMNGQLICYKARPDDEEIQTAIALEKKLGMKLVSRETFTLSDGSDRVIMVFEKIAKPKVHLPRRIGLAQKSPFKISTTC